MTKSKKSLLTSVFFIFAILSVALLIVFGCGSFVSARADDGGVSGVATVKVGENAAVEYDSIEEAWAAAEAATSPATVKMFTGATTTDTLTVESGKNVTLDLNGHTLEYDNAETQNSVITVKGEFTLKDSSVAQSGVITGGTGHADASKISRGGGVLINGGTFIMAGGTISGNTAMQGGGVCVNNRNNEKGAFTMTGGTICGNEALEGGGYGGGVCIGYNSSFAMEGGEICGNAAKRGGGVYVGYICTFDMTGGAINDNTATFVDGDKYGGGYGGGVYMNSNCTFDMTDGEISDNTADENGGGVYVEGTFNVSGAPEITGNKKSDNTVNNIYLDTFKTITVTGELTEGANIGVFNTGDVATGYTQADAPSTFFIPDDSANDCVYIRDDNGNVSIGVHDWSDEWATDGSNHWHECTRCGEIKDEAAHIGGAAATCTAPQTCTVCERQLVAALEHDFEDDFTVDKEATCTEEGSKSKHCKRCDEKTEVTAIPKIPHALTHVPETPATEDKDGNKEHWSCDECDKLFSDEDGTNEITDKSSVVIPKLNNNDNSVLWIILIVILCAVIAVEVGVIIYRAKRKANAKAKENEQ